MTRRQQALTVAELDAAFWDWWLAGGAGPAAPARSAARRRGDPEPPEHTEPQTWLFEGGKYRLQGGKYRLQGGKEPFSGGET